MYIHEHIDESSVVVILYIATLKFVNSSIDVAILHIKSASIVIQIFISFVQIIGKF